MPEKGQDLIQLRWHSRGGQGAKTAADFFTQVAISEGKYSQAFPEYGPERSGAPMRSYTRISSEPIKLHSAVYKPDAVIILDPTLVGTVNVWEGLSEEGEVVINTRLTPQEARKEFNITGHKVFTIDATGIALDELGRNIPNMPMVGALVKVSGLLELDHVIEGLRKTFSAKFGKEVVEKNVRAINRAYKEVRTEDA
ncbi:2-oxoacid:acceptor oxidoreductase family protein [bacterium]|nr:2-oxoacid:acceptor oxidoreductase family protein [bacterium]